MLKEAQHRKWLPSWRMLLSSAGGPRMQIRLKHGRSHEKGLRHATHTHTPDHGWRPCCTDVLVASGSWAVRLGPEELGSVPAKGQDAALQSGSPDRAAKGFPSQKHKTPAVSWQASSCYLMSSLKCFQVEAQPGAWCLCRFEGEECHKSLVARERPQKGALPSLQTWKWTSPCTPLLVEESIRNWSFQSFSHLLLEVPSSGHL